MLICEHIPTWIARINEDHGNSVVICHSFKGIKVNFPTFLRKKIEVANFKKTTSGTRIILWVAWSWEENVGTRTCKNR
jgi:hypothetical protein